MVLVIFSCLWSKISVVRLYFLTCKMGFRHNSMNEIIFPNQHSLLLFPDSKNATSFIHPVCANSLGAFSRFKIEPGLCQLFLIFNRMYWLLTTSGIATELKVKNRCFSIYTNSKCISISNEIVFHGNATGL